MSKPLKYGLIGAGIVLLLLIVVPFLIPAGAYRARIEQAAFDRTGRELKIGGALHVRLYPVLGVRAEKVTLANVPGGHARFMATMDDFNVGVRFLPLLAGRFEVSEIVLDKPVINLERDAAGHGNWVFRSSAPDGKNNFSPRFSGIVINDGTVNYRNAAGKTRSVERANLTIGLTAVDRPVTVDGEVRYRTRHVALEARLGNLSALAPEQTRDVEFSLTSDLLQGSFKGSLSAKGDAEGTLKLDTTNIRGVADWLGEGLPADGGFKTLSLESRIETKGNSIALPEESLRLDGMTITGNMSADLGGKQPKIGGDVVIDRLDLNRYIESGPKTAASTSKAAASDGWGTSPIDLSVLHLFDANLTIDTAVLRVRGLHIGKTHLAATLDDGLLNVALDPISLYGGTGKATLTVDVRGPMPQFQNNLAFSTVSMRALLSDTLGAQRIAGRGTLSLSVASQGGSADAIMRNLSGKGSLRIDNGQIQGVDLGGVARLIRTALSGEVVNPNASTPFSQMDGSFAIAHGVLATKNFHLEGKVIRTTGTGTVDIGNRTLDFAMKPKAVLLPIGTGFGVGFPFRAYGPWRNITYSADVSGVVTGLVSDVFHTALSVPGSAIDFITGSNAQQKPKSKPTKKKSFFDNLFQH